MGYLIALVAAAAMGFDQNGEAGAKPASTSSRLEIHGLVFSLFLNERTGGPGTQPPQGDSFAAGGVESPLSPYDPFTSAPLVPGTVWQNQGVLDFSWRRRGATLSARLGLSNASGGATAAAFWAEPLLPGINPHIGPASLDLPIRFPTRSADDPGRGDGVKLLRAAVGANDDRWLVQGGWFSLAHTNSFVLAAPPSPSVIPSLGITTSESLGDGPPQLDDWSAAPATLFFRGFSTLYRSGSVTAEAADAALPAPGGTPARVLTFVYDNTDGKSRDVSIQVAKVFTGGDPINATVLFGANPDVLISPQGALPSSFLFGQRESMVGVHWQGTVSSSLSGSIDVAHSLYFADGSIRGQTNAGGYYHVSLLWGSDTGSATIHWYRFEPTYATLVLPYGVPENQWNVAYSWPGPWLKSTYQLVDNSVLGVNREGPVLRLARKTERVDVRASYGSFRQIEPLTIEKGTRTGFVEGFFLPQLDATAATLGRQKRAAAYVQWSPQPGSLSVDFVDDQLHRDGGPGRPLDAVSYDNPQIVLTASKRFGKTALLVAGWARYGMRGTWADGARTNVDYSMRETFFGSQVAQSKRAQAMVHLRNVRFSGLPIFNFVGGANLPPPDFHGTLLLLEQRYSF